MEQFSHNLKSRPLQDKEFEKISGIIYDICRINLQLGKKELVQARLSKRLRKLGLESYKDYIDYIEEDKTGSELSTMVDVLTTNLTSFFREPDHFHFLRDNILKNQYVDETRRFRIWSAGCSTGEEAYSQAIIVKDFLNNRKYADVKILASDISSRVLAAAREGIFAGQRLKDMPESIRQKYFNKSFLEDGSTVYRAASEIKDLITFRRLNLMVKWPMKNAFDVIFCRNVMIYFDKKTQEELVSRFFNILTPGGYFFVGHSESLANIKHKFGFVRPGIYLKNEQDEGFTR